jgi:hypothetical protein
MPPVFGTPMIDLYMMVGVAGVFLLVIGGFGQVAKIARRDKKAHEEFLRRFKATSGLDFKDRDSLIVNNIGYDGVPAAVILTDGTQESLWAPSVDGTTLRLRAL